MFGENTRFLHLLCFMKTNLPDLQGLLLLLTVCLCVKILDWDAILHLTGCHPDRCTQRTGEHGSYSQSSHVTCLWHQNQRQEEWPALPRGGEELRP